MEMRAIRGTGLTDIPLGSGLFGNPASQELRAAQDYDLFQIVKLVRRRLKLVLAVSFLGTGLAIFVTLYILPSFTAKALLIMGDRATAQASQPDDSSIDTQIAAITSEANLNRVLLTLWKDPTLRAAVPRLQDLERRLKVMQELRSRLISVTFTASSPSIAAEVANRIVRLYLDSFDEQSAQIANQTAAQLAGRREDLIREIAQAQAELSTLRASQTAAPGAQSALDIRIGDLTRQLGATQSEGSLLQSQQDERRQQEIVSPAVRLFSLAAVPERPSSTRPILIIFPAFIASLIWGACLAVLIGRLSQKLRNEEEVAEALGVPCIGSIPRSRRVRRSGPFDYIRAAPRGPYAEAIRSIVVTTLLMEPNRTTTILISSSLSGDGKTTFASSFAAYACQLQRRVLLVDLDFTRRGGLYGVRRGAPGIFDVLADACRLKETIQTMGRDRLGYLPLGRCPEDPLPLIAGDRMSHILRQLRETYDCVVINAPPVLDLTETRLIVAMADRILLVVRRGRTKRAQACEALHILMSSALLRSSAGPANIVGTVLTFTSEKARPRRNVPAARLRASAKRNSQILQSDGEDPGKVGARQALPKPEAASI